MTSADALVVVTVGVADGLRNVVVRIYPLVSKSGVLSVPHSEQVNGVEVYELVCREEANAVGVLPEAGKERVRVIAHVVVACHL